MAEAANPFWSFSQDLYGRTGVARACLALQDCLGADVNLLLFCCWAGQRGRLLAPAEIQALVDAVAPWQDEVVRPLRGVRRWLKGRESGAGPAAEALRQATKAQELEAERLEQDILHAALRLEEGTPCPAAAIANLNRYFAALGCAPGVSDAANLAVLLTAAFAETLRPLDALWGLQEGPAGL